MVVWSLRARCLQLERERQSQRRTGKSLQHSQWKHLPQQILHLQLKKAAPQLVGECDNSALLYLLCLSALKLVTFSHLSCQLFQPLLVFTFCICRQKVRCWCFHSQLDFILFAHCTPQISPKLPLKSPLLCLCLHPLVRPPFRSRRVSTVTPSPHKPLWSHRSWLIS